MLEKLLEKAPAAPIVQSDIEDYPTEECFDYILFLLAPYPYLQTGNPA